MTTVAEAASVSELLRKLQLVLLQFTIFSRSLGLSPKRIGTVLKSHLSLCGVNSALKTMLDESFRDISSVRTHDMEVLGQFFVRCKMFAGFFQQEFDLSTLVQSGKMKSAICCVLISLTALEEAALRALSHSMSEVDLFHAVELTATLSTTFQAVQNFPQQQLKGQFFSHPQDLSKGLDDKTLEQYIVTVPEGLAVRSAPDLRSNLVGIFPEGMVIIMDTNLILV